MPYKSIEDLPDRIRKHLPNHAQEIYFKAYNNAWEEYKDKSKRRGNEGQEETSHKVAWAAVKTKYHKDKDGNWAENKGVASSE